MFVILTYDVRQKRQSKTRKICKKYLYHVQKSVFEGYLTERQLNLLEQELENVINPDEDSLCVQGAVLPQRHKRRIGFQHGK